MSATLAIYLRHVRTGLLVGLYLTLAAQFSIPTYAQSTSVESVTRVVLDVAHQGEIVEVTLDPVGFSGFLAVKESFGGLEFAGEHTADDYVDGVFILLEPRRFEYVLHVPDSADPGDKFLLEGQWWTDPSAMKNIPSSTITIGATSKIGDTEQGGTVEQGGVEETSGKSGHEPLITITRFLTTDEEHAEQTQVNVGNNILITVDYSTSVVAAQPVVFITQIVDSDGFVQFIDTAYGEAHPNQMGSFVGSWVPASNGTYKVEIFFWTDLDEPLPLSEKATYAITVK